MPYRRAALLLAAVGTLLVATALPAAAHNELKSSNPAAGAMIDNPPAQIVLTFGENLIPGQTTVTVTGPDGVSAATGEPVLAGPVATVPVALSHAGVHTVAYKVVADDGDITDTKFTFTFVMTAAPPTTTTTTTASPTTTTTAAPTSQPQAAAASDDSGSTWWPWLVIPLAVILIAVVLLILRRRRASASS